MEVTAGDRRSEVLTAHHPLAVADGNAGDGRWVLVVEDDPKFGELLTRALGRAGLGSVLADCGDAALRAAQLDAPLSAVVVDVMIPHPDGIEVCRQLRRSGWGVPVIVISARTSPTDRERVRAAGADAFLPKPFALADLVELVAALIGRPARPPETLQP